MSLYPSLEDMKVDQMATAQQAQYEAATGYIQQHAMAINQAPPAYHPDAAANVVSLYPSLDSYMGLDLVSVQQTMAVVPQQSMQVAPVEPLRMMQAAPISQGSVGIKRAEIKQGIRQIIVCKDGNGKIGLRLRSVDKGIFIAFVYKESPAALAGMRFGDQVLQINEETVAGWSTDKTMNYLKKCSPEKITFAIRDRPFERTIVLQKDSVGHIGFCFKDGKISSLVKDSSAARNGVLIDHQLAEVNGQNVIGMKDKYIAETIEAAPRTVTITILPSVIYGHIIKSIGSSLIKSSMDHSVPEV